MFALTAAALKLADFFGIELLKKYLIGSNVSNYENRKKSAKSLFTLDCPMSMVLAQLEIKM